MKGGADFLWKSINALMEQTFQDFEIIITKAGKMAENTNAGIKKARGKYIKILYLDDRFAHPKALEEMVNHLEETNAEWLISGVNTNPHPYWTEDIDKGNNKLGSPSALMFINQFEDNLLFDERMSWLLDCDLYKRMYDKLVLTILPGVHVILETGDHQMTNILTNEEKLAEHNLINEKYA